MPIVLEPISEGSADLVSSAVAVQQLAASGVALSAAQLAALPLAITAASREIVRYCGRPFASTAYTEIVTPEGTRQDRGEPMSAKLSYFPVISVTRCATGRTAGLLIKNTDQSTNQEASARFAFSGDVEYHDLSYTGLTLSRTASGTMTNNAVSWTTASPFTTIASVASTINGLGGGWSATAITGTPNLSLFPAAYLVGARETKGAFDGGVSLEVFSAPATNYDIERASGILRLRGGNGAYSGGGYGVSAWGDPFGDSSDGFADNQAGQYQVSYTAGFSTVPESIQQVCCELAKGTLERLSTDSTLKSETAKDYQWTARDAIATLPDGALQVLMLYKDWKV